MSSFFNKIGQIITPTSSSSSSSSSVTSTVRNALYNKSKQQQQQQQQSASKAKERLSLILASQRNSTLLQDVDMQALQRDVLQVLKKYISIVDGGTTRTSTSYNRNSRSSSNTKGSTAGIMTHPSSSSGVLHCDVKNIPNVLRNGEQMTLLEMTVEIDPRQTILLHRQQQHHHREGGRGGGLVAKEEEELKG